MKDRASIEAAKFICNTGKIVHDRILKIQSEFFSSSENGAANVLSLGQLNAVKILAESGELTMNELAVRLSVSPPSASTMVDRLVEKGVFCREHSTKDRRKVVVRVSPEAAKIAEEIGKSTTQFFVELVDKIGLETAQKWCEVLSTVEAALTETPETQYPQKEKPA